MKSTLYAIESDGGPYISADPESPDRTVAWLYHNPSSAVQVTVVVAAIHHQRPLLVNTPSIVSARSRNTVTVALVPALTSDGTVSVNGAEADWIVTEQLFEAAILFASLTVIDSVAFETGDNVIVD